LGQRLSSVEDLRWDRQNMPISIHDLQILQDSIPYKFPKDFIKLLNISNGGDIWYAFDYFNKSLNRQDSLSIYTIYGVNGEYNLIKEYKDPPEFFPADLVIFSSTGGGGAIAFDYRLDPATDNPPVVYWMMGFEPEEAVSPVAANFEEFLGMLREPEPFPEDEV